MSLRFKENVIALQTILNKEIIRFLRIWSQSLLPPAITMTLYFIIFGKLIGSQLKNIQDFSYMQYIVPGLTMMSIMTSSYSNTSSSFFGAKLSRSIEEMLIAPMSNYTILLGYVLSGALRGILVGFIVLVIATFFTHIHFYSLPFVVFIALLAALLFSTAGLLNGIFAKKFDDVAFIPTFILTPLTYLGGVFYSVKQLPPFWQKISIFNPIFDIVDTFKFGMLGLADLNVYCGLLLIIIFLLSAFFSCLYLLKKGTGLKS